MTAQGLQKSSISSGVAIDFRGIGHGIAAHDGIVRSRALVLETASEPTAKKKVDAQESKLTREGRWVGR